MSQVGVEGLVCVCVCGGGRAWAGPGLGCADRLCGLAEPGRGLGEAPLPCRLRGALGCAHGHVFPLS